MRSAKPTILIIGSLPPPAIGPSVAMELLLRAPALNDSFQVSFLDISDRRSPHNIGKFDFTNVFLAIKQSCQCWGRLVTLRPDVVYLGISQGLWGYLRDLAFILPALCLGRRLILHLRGSEFRAFYETMPNVLRWLTRKILFHTARMIVLGRRLQPLFDGLMENQKVVVIPNGISCATYDRTGPPSEDDRYAAKRLLYFSSLMRRKGVFVLLNALPKVFAQHPDAQMTIAGLWQDASEEAEAHRLLGQSGIGEKVHFVGEVIGPKKVELLCTSSLLVFTPVAPEGLPWVILEAMSAGLPVITSDQGAIAEVVLDGVTGTIISPEPDGVAGEICRLLENPGLAAEMGKAGRARVERQFSEDDYLEKMVGLFRGIACSGGTVGQLKLRED